MSPLAPWGDVCVGGGGGGGIPERRWNTNMKNYREKHSRGHVSQTHTYTISLFSTHSHSLLHTRAPHTFIHCHTHHTYTHHNVVGVDVLRFVNSFHRMQLDTRIVNYTQQNTDKQGIRTGITPFTFHATSALHQSQ